MNMETILNCHDVKLVSKKDSRFMRLLGMLMWFNPTFMEGYWTTIVLPGYRYCFYPIKYTQTQAAQRRVVIEHELIHVIDADNLFEGNFVWLSNITFAACYVCFPLPCLNWFRWWAERRAYLTTLGCEELVAGRPHNAEYIEAWIERTVDKLWSRYFYTWPKAWMRTWFYEQFEWLEAA